MNLIIGSRIFNLLLGFLNMIWEYVKKLFRNIWMQVYSFPPDISIEIYDMQSLRGKFQVFVRPATQKTSFSG